MRNYIWACPYFSEDEEQTNAAARILMQLSQEADDRSDAANTLIAFANQRPNDLINQMFDQIPGNDFQTKLDSCNSCYCCETHQTNRPTIFEPWIELPQSNNSFYQKQNRCPCKCRHAARFICRQAPLKTISKIRSSPTIKFSVEDAA
tara:strand:+ start:197 stop:640 length:444 start_codon:yes stop_codon:yes gene_type:complete